MYSLVLIGLFAWLASCESGRDVVYGDSIHSRIAYSGHSTNVIIESHLSFLRGSHRSGIYYSTNVTLVDCDHVEVVNGEHLHIVGQKHLYIYGERVSLDRSQHDFYLEKIRDLWRELNNETGGVYSKREWKGREERKLKPLNAE